MLNPASVEQQEIVDAIATNNVVVNSVAGSGKTTTILHIGKKYPDKRILVLTYNKTLKEETREKAVKLGLNNVEIHSFHAAAVKYLAPDCYDDLALLRHLNAITGEVTFDDENDDDVPEEQPKPNNLHLLDKLSKLANIGGSKVVDSFNKADTTGKTNPTGINNTTNPTGNLHTTSKNGKLETISTKIPIFDIIVVDECQDMTFLYYRFICYIISESWCLMPPESIANYRICVIGDSKQCIYEFKEADERFLGLASKIFNFNNVPFVSLGLTESFRINKHMAKFITTCLVDQLGQPAIPKLKSNKEGPRVTYLIYDPFRHLQTVVAELIIKRLKDVGQNRLTPNDIFILAPSVRISNAKNPLKLLANRLTQSGYNIFMPNNDDEKLNENEINNKITFCTYHQSKGRERKLVLVMNFDNNLFNLHNFKNHNGRVLPNEIYVACTRATEELLLLHSSNSLPFKFLNLDIKAAAGRASPYCEFVNVVCLGKFTPTEKAMPPEEYQIVTELVRFLSSELIAETESMYKKREIVPRGTTISLKKATRNTSKIGRNMSYIENVSSINGIAIPAYYELVKKGRMTITEELGKRAANGQIKIFGKIYNINFTSHTGEIKRGAKKKNVPPPAQPAQPELSDDQKKQLLVQNILYKSTLFSAFKSGLLFKLEQINDYNWLSYEDFVKCFNNFHKHAGAYEFKHEVFVQKTDKEFSDKTLIITGFIDAVDQNGNLWEFKCTSELQPEHFLQLILYLYLRGQMLYPTLDTDCELPTPPDYVTKEQTMYLFNVVCENLFEINISYYTARQIYRIIMHYREGKKKLGETAFIEKINEVKNKCFKTEK